jgi:hypothetical protein
MPRIAPIVVALSIPFVVLAFWPIYLSRPFPDTDRYTHLHAVAGTLWLALLIVQPILVHRYHYKLHRLFGNSSYFFAALFFVASILLSHHRLVSMDDQTFAVEGYGHYLPFYASVVFASAYLLGLYYRQLPDAHGRFMLATAIPLIDPVFGRVLFFYLPPLPHPLLYQAFTFSIATALAAVLVFSYKGPKEPRRALIAYFVLLVTLEIGWFTFAYTSTWIQLVSWFRGLSLT